MIVHNVQVHPVYDGHVNDHKVIREEEFKTREDAIMWAGFYNQHRNNWNINDFVAVYTGAIDTETGENLVIIDWTIVADDYLTEFEKDQLKYEGKIDYPARELVW